VRALFVISIHSYAREARPVVEEFLRRGVETEVLLGWSGASADEWLARWSDLGAEVRFVPEPRASAPPSQDEQNVVAPTTRRRALRSRAGLALYRVRQFAVDVKRFRGFIRFGEEILAETTPDVVLFGPYGGAGIVEQGIARACQRRGILMCCLSYSAYLGEVWEIEARSYWLGREGFGLTWLADASIVNRVIAHAFPGWVRRRNGRGMFRFDPVRQLLAWVVGLRERNVWQYPSESFDLCFVEFDLTRDLLRRSGYPMERVVVVGKPTLDEVLAGLQEPAHVEKILGATGGPGFILYNVEPAAEHFQASWEQHWRHIDDALDALSRLGLPVVLSLHPLCNPDDYRPRAERRGFRMLVEPSLVELYPHCGVSVSYPSSLNPLAAVFGKPLVVYDWWGIVAGPDPAMPSMQIDGARYATNADELEQVVRAVAANGSAERKNTTPPSRAAAAIIFETVAERTGR
jgi:hypothetical protein